MWKSFDESTLTEAGTGETASVTVPAGARRTLVAVNFESIDLAVPGSSYLLTFTFSVSDGLAGIAGGTRPLGAGLFNSGTNSASFIDDAGYFFWVNGTSAPSVELRRRLTSSTSTSLLNPTSDSFANMGTGNVGAPTGSFADGTVYTVSILLIANASTGNISFGLSDNAGVSIAGDGLSIGRYTNPETTEVHTFDTFGLMFLNTTEADSVLAVHSISLTPIPEPSVIAALMGLGVLCLTLARRRR